MISPATFNYILELLEIMEDQLKKTKKSKDVEVDKFWEECRKEIPIGFLKTEY